MKDHYNERAGDLKNYVVFKESSLLIIILYQTLNHLNTVTKNMEQSKNKYTQSVYLYNFIFSYNIVFSNRVSKLKSLMWTMPNSVL